MSNNTTTLALASVADYVAGDVKVKAAFRRDADALMKAAIGAGDLAGAKAAMDRIAEFKAASASTSRATEVNYTALAVDRIAHLFAAIDAIREGRFDGAPEGFKVTDEDIVAHNGNVTLDADIVNGLTKVRRANKRDLNSLVASVFADANKGTTMTVSEIVKKVAAIGDGYVPSSGAVAAALGSKKGVAGVTFIPANKGKGVKAAGRKA